MRENSLAGLGMGHATIRRYLKELGGRLAARNAISAADDIFWLNEIEVKLLAADLDQGRELQDFSAKAPERKALWKAQMKLNPPAVLPLDSPFAKMIPWARQGENDREVRGVAASGGCVTGTARVLFGPEDFGRMQPGDILVAPTTSPAWTRSSPWLRPW